MAKFIQRITLIDSSGPRPVAHRIHKAKKKKRKVSKHLRAHEKAHRRALQAANTYTTELLERHHKANRKGRDRYVRDFDYNHARATRKALKKLRS